MTDLRLALYQPDIAQNTGTMLRMAACFGVAVDVIGPTGFDMTDRALRRAGLDYLDHVDLTRHVDWQSFRTARQSAPRRLVLATTHAPRSYLDFRFNINDVIVMGRESAGVPDSVRDACDASISIPVRNGLRSLNVAVAAGIVVAEALRQTAHSP
ncbi:MAG TPA: TrmH family RNA methyltransferase [Hyphomicrobiaceae bacterium]|nr:TrmH family RNA methyltransferase [Hyphomicrobiaceae bacterium]